MKRVKGILFDFNGTLFFDSDFHIEAFQKIFPELGAPAPDCYVLAAEKLGLSVSDCLIFEDGTSGIMAANAANAAGTVAIYDETLPSPLCEELKVDMVIHSFKDFKEILSHYEIVR